MTETQNPKEEIVESKAEEILKKFSGHIHYKKLTDKEEIQQMHRRYCEANFQNVKRYEYTQYASACMRIVDNIIEEKRKITKKNVKRRELMDKELSGVINIKWKELVCPICKEKIQLDKEHDFNASEDQLWCPKCEELLEIYIAWDSIIGNKIFADVVSNRKNTEFREKCAEKSKGT